MPRCGSLMTKFLLILRLLLEILSGIPARIFGSRNQRLLKQYSAVAERINAHESAMAALSDGALAGKTGEFKKRYAEGEKIEDLLPEAFAVVREAAKRTVRMRHFDVQLIGGMVLHDGKIAE